jgi:hypothetical protein
LNVEQIFAFADAHPELAAVLVTSVVWPLLTGLLSLGYHALEDRYPVAVAYLRAAGLDLPRTLAAIRAAWPKRLPPPPPALILLLVTLGGGVMGLSGCGSPMLVAVRTADAAALVGDQARPVLEQECIEPIQRATMAELVELRRACDPAMLAYDSLRVAHLSLRSAVLAVDAGTLDPGRLAPLVVRLGKAAFGLSESIRIVAGGK